MKTPFRYFNGSPEAMYVRYPLSGASMDPADTSAAFRCRLPSPDALRETEELDGG